MYIEGNPLKHSELKRTLVEFSQCVVILANKGANDPDLEDKINIMYALSIKYEQDQIICVEELKLNLLAKTCLCPGFNTIISFLMKSSKPDFENNKKYKPSTKEWIDDYMYGMQNEIYEIQMEPEIFAGYSFSQISSQLYKQLQIILFAIEVPIFIDNQVENTVFINPADYLFENFTHVGYVIAHQNPEKSEIDKIKFSDQIQRDFQYPVLKKQSTVDYQLQSLIKQQQNLQHTPFYQNKAGIHALSLNQVQEKKFENHFIVYGILPSLKHLLMPFRAKSLETIHPILIMNQEPIPTSIWKQLNQFPKIYFIQGSPLDYKDLERACVSKALAFLILSKIQDEDEESTQAPIIDAETIFIYKKIQNLNP
ncbi:hypothetical protein PPERSA_09945 [Pseudocohnilembus persalinus]|uniref:Uncharacterized protein n=1 Tax=Pseudocohnilembus persalinus TaxID=266149 RepID=A0A0V0QJN3_PSEPJ|nr:hypothetical protein PPERSA_09945 [Pseudocohnilembus persalinus]|eukprot:KRX02328.1 hypothetical protein PPERSA_09945 [Pseudocohnilembus persalinus]